MYCTKHYLSYHFSYKSCVPEYLPLFDLLFTPPPFYSPLPPLPFPLSPSPSLHHLPPPQCTMVLRDGRRSQVEVDRLVVGDIVDVTFGDRLPADIRVIKCSGFKVGSIQNCITFLCICISVSPF